MYCDLCPPLTLRFMGIGFSLREAEHLAAFLVTGVVIVVTIMGYTIRPPSDENRPGHWTCSRSDTVGIHPGIPGSQYCGFTNLIVDALRRSPALSTCHCQVSA